MSVTLSIRSVAKLCRKEWGTPFLLIPDNLGQRQDLEDCQEGLPRKRLISFRRPTVHSRQLLLGLALNAMLGLARRDAFANRSLAIFRRMDHAGASELLRLSSLLTNQT